MKEYSGIFIFFNLEIFKIFNFLFIFFSFLADFDATKVLFMSMMFFEKDNITQNSSDIAEVKNAVKKILH